MTTLPAVVTILDLAAAASATTTMMLEAAWTNAGVATTNALSISQIMTTGLGALPTGGATGQILQKSSGTNFAAAWSNISSLVTVNSTSGLQESGSTTIALALASVAGLSVLGAAGTTQAIPLPITAATGAQVLRANDAGTALEFGAINLASAAAVTGILPGANMSAVNLSTAGAGGVQGILQAANITAINLATTGAGGVQNVLRLAQGGWSTTTLTAFGIVYGNGTSTPGITAAGTTAWPLVGQGTAAAAVFTTLGVLGGGVGFTSYTIGDMLVATTATALVRLAAGTAGWVLTGRGAGTSPAYAQITTTSLTGIITVPFGGTGTSAFVPFGVIVAGTTATAFLQSAAPSTAGNILIDQGATTLAAFRTVTGDLTMGALGTATIATNAVGFTKLAQGSGLSVFTYNTTTLANATTVAAGGANQVLGVNTAGTGLAFGLPARVLLTTITANNAATIGDTTSFTTLYRHYMMTLDNLIPTVTNNQLVMQLSTNAGAAYIAANYVTGSTATTALELTATGVATTASVGVSGFLWLFNPLGTSNAKSMRGQFVFPNAGGTAQDGGFGLGYWNGTTTVAVNAFQIKFSSGNISSGTVKLYGYT